MLRNFARLLGAPHGCIAQQLIELNRLKLELLLLHPIEIPGKAESTKHTPNLRSPLHCNGSQ